MRYALIGILLLVGMALHAQSNTKIVDSTLLFGCVAPKAIDQQTLAQHFPDIRLLPTPLHGANSSEANFWITLFDTTARAEFNFMGQLCNNYGFVIRGLSKKKANAIYADVLQRYSSLLGEHDKREETETVESHFVLEEKITYWETVHCTYSVSFAKIYDGYCVNWGVQGK